MKPVILMRPSLAEEAEELAAVQRFRVYHARSGVPVDSLVIGRYSVLPYYRELESDLATKGSWLVNTSQQHNYVADLGEYVRDLGDMTPLTWNRLHELPEHMSFVLKGATNSKKSYWRTHMFAADRKVACQVHSRLCADGLVGDQDIYIRQFVPLHTYFEDVVGLPVTKEFRFFVLRGKVLCGGFYWANHAEEVARLTGKVPDPSDVPTAFLQEAIRRIGNKVNFYTLDVAQTASGEWIVIELNDGSMAGLSCIEPDVFYQSLADVDWSAS